MSVPKEAQEFQKEVLRICFIAIDQKVDYRAIAGCLFSVAWSITEQAHGTEETAAVMRRHIDLALKSLPRPKRY